MDRLPQIEIPEPVRVIDRLLNFISFHESAKHGIESGRLEKSLSPDFTDLVSLELNLEKLLADK